jgi:hypothetical protein
MPRGQVVPHREGGADPAEVREHDGAHDDGGRRLHRQLREVGERVGPEAADRHVDERDGAGDEHAGDGRRAGDDVQNHRDRRVLGADVEHLQQAAAPRQQLLRREVVARLQVLGRRSHPVPRPQPRPARRDEKRPEQHRRADRQRPPDVQREPGRVGHRRVPGEHDGARPRDVVRHARHPPGHAAAGGEEVVRVADTPVGPGADEHHPHEVQRQDDPVGSLQRRLPRQRARGPRRTHGAWTAGSDAAIVGGNRAGLARRRLSARGACGESRTRRRSRARPRRDSRSARSARRYRSRSCGRRGTARCPLPSHL